MAQQTGGYLDYIHHCWSKTSSDSPFIKLPKETESKPEEKLIPKFILYNIEEQMVPCKSTAKEVSFEWSHHRISSTDSQVRTTLHVSIVDSGSEVLAFEIVDEIV